MKFTDVINYLEEMVEKELPSINPTTDPTTIINVDRDNQKYQLAATANARSLTRTFKQLEGIWNELTRKGFVNVDQAVGGSGTSRHQPETILANLPCVEHFKYENKKHLYLRSEGTHKLGSIKELSASEVRSVRRRIERYRNFDISQFHTLHSLQLVELKEKLDNIFTKYPGESDVARVGEILISLEELDLKLSEAVVGENYQNSKNMLPSEDEEEEGEDGEFVQSLTRDEEEEDETPNKTKGIKSSRIKQITPTLSLVFDRVMHDEIDLKPEYQRQERIWPLPDQAKLIESILLGLPIPVFYFAERPILTNDLDAEIETEWVIIDGLQRITSIVAFMKGEFALKKLSQLPGYDDCYFHQLPRKEQRKIREYQILGHLIQISKDSDEMVRELFHRINTYGKNLSYQEIRSALYPGTCNQYIKNFAKKDAFIEGVPATINTSRMLDVEYCLRAISFMALGYESYDYVKNDDFLCHAMRALNKHAYFVNGNISEIDSIYIDIDYRFRSALNTISSIFGEDAYKKEVGGKVNKVLFELLVSVFSLMSDDQRDIACIEENATEIKARLFYMIDNDVKLVSWISEAYASQKRGFEYSISSSTGKRVTVLYRFESLIKMINEVCGFNFVLNKLLTDSEIKAART